MGTLVLADSSGAATSLNLGAVLRRQFWLIMACVGLGCTLGTLYWVNASGWYESSAKIIVSQRVSQLTSADSSNNLDQSMVDEDVLANHMEIVRSRRIVEFALKRHGLIDLESIKAELEPDVDPAEYVIDHIQLKRGGEGAAKDARVLSVSFEHTDPDDAKLILDAVMIEYQMFLGTQLTQAMSEAGRLVEKAQVDLEKALTDAQNEYVAARQNAPVLFQGAGSGNVFLEQYRRLHEELLTLDIQQSTVKTRLAKAKQLVQDDAEGKKIDMDALGIIDPESLQRLGVFAGLQANAGKSPEFLWNSRNGLKKQRRGIPTC